MNVSLTAACAALFVAATAVAQNPIAMPAGTTVYNGFSRGYSFDAPSAFEITSLALPPDAFQAGDTGGYLVEVNGVQGFYQVGVAAGLNGDAPVSVPGGSIVCLPGDTVMVVGNWSPATTGNFSAHNSYASGGGTYATNIEGVSTTLSRAGVQWDIGDAGSATAARFTGVAGSFGRILAETGPLTVTPVPALVANAEATPFSTTLDGSGGEFRGGEFLRWNYDDTAATSNGFSNLGSLAVTTLNLGAGAAPATASTPLIPNFVQQWSGSAPAGFISIVGPYIVGSPDELLSVPVGVLSQFDTIRFQSLIYDAGAGTVPFKVMNNVIEFGYTECGYGENFDASLSDPTGWVQSGIQNWTVDASGTPSGGTGPTSAFNGSNYLYCETSSPAAAGDTYIIDTAPVANTAAPTNSLAFQLSRIGATIGTLNVYMDDGAGTFNLLASYAGPDPNQSQNVNEWSSEVIDLTNGGTLTVPANIVIRFEYIMGTSFTGDLAIDAFCLK